MFIFSNISLNDLLKRINDTFHNIFVNTAPELDKLESLVSAPSTWFLMRFMSTDHKYLKLKLKQFSFFWIAFSFVHCCYCISSFNFTCFFSFVCFVVSFGEGQNVPPSKRSDLKGSWLINTRWTFKFIPKSYNLHNKTLLSLCFWGCVNFLGVQVKWKLIDRLCIARRIFCFHLHFFSVSFSFL